MLKIVNSILVMTLLVGAFVVYSLEYSIKQGERDIALAKKQTRQAKETIGLLEAEWSLLSRPSRVQRLAADYLKLRPMSAKQVSTVEKLAAELPPRPVQDPSLTNNDPIADMLKGLN